MRNSYIANSSEALNLHNGTQSAIVVAMKLPKWCKRIELQGGRQKDPTCYSLVDTNENNAYDTNGEYLTLMDIVSYALGQEVYVRETWAKVDEIQYDYKADDNVGTEWTYEEWLNVGWQSPVTMPKSAARTRFKIVSCEAVRVYDVSFDNIRSILGYDENYKNTTNLTGYFRQHIVAKLGQSAWDNNHFIWYYKIENI
jgi:hypothetical protein